MKVFITGATGYIGGSLAATLVRQGHDVVGLARSEEKARGLSSRGITPVIGTLFSTAAIRAAVEPVDAVLNAADSDNAYVVADLLEALQGTGKTLLHISGSSIVGDRARGVASEVVWHDTDSLVPRLEKRGRWAIDRAILEAGEQGVRSIVICPSMVYGRGLGERLDSVQVPTLQRLASAEGRGVYLGPGLNVWSNVHIEDLMQLCLLAVHHAPGGTFCFAENGEVRLRDLAEAIAAGLGLPDGARSMSMETAVERLGAGAAEFSLASNSRVRATRARTTLGWRPRHDDLLEGVLDGRYLARPS
jgi:nucleoside-diphosphate-sugar epimerase